MSKQTFNIANIEIFSIFRDLSRRLWIVLIAGCIGIMITFSVMKENYVPTYTSTAIYVVSPSQSSGYVMTNKKIAQSVVEVFSNLLNTDIMNTRIMRDLNRTHLTSTKAVELIEETNLMKITVTSEDPIESFQTIGAIMNNYYDLSDYLNSDAVFDELKAPIVATQPNNAFTPRTRSLQVGGICALLALVVLIILSVFRKTIKTESAVEDNLETNLVGTIYHEEKNRTIKAKIVQSVKTLLITSPIITAKFIESVNNIRMKVEYARDRDTTKNVFMVTSVCENEGKSTVSLNTALSLAKEGKKVILIDADMRKPAIFKMLDIPKSKVTDMVKLLQGKCGLDEVIYKDNDMNIDMIMSNTGHSRTHEYVKSGAMKDLIKKCSMLADYVIVDTPPMALVSDAEALLDRVDYCMMVIRQDFSYQKDINNCITIIEDSPCEFLGCVLNDYKVFRVNSKEHAYGYGYGYGENKEKVVEIYEDK